MGNLNPDSYTITLSRRASKEFRKLDPPTASRINAAIRKLSFDPHPPGCVRVQTRERTWRIRVGDWRVGYEVDDESRRVLVTQVEHRSRFYGQD